jgi:DNA polymerase elongation subunit (family B)
MSHASIPGSSSHEAEDERLFGWDPTPGIVSIWAHRDGRAIIWRRDGDRVVCDRERYRPWVVATTLNDLTHLGPALRQAESAGAERGLVTYQELDGPAGAYCYLLSAHNGQALERAVLLGASQRTGRRIDSLRELAGDYYAVGPNEQYLMQTGRAYFRGMQYADLHRLQFDLETTALDPRRGRIFMVAVRDSRGFAATVEAPAPADEQRLIVELCAIIRERNPDIIENHNLHGFDLPFLVERAELLGIPLALGRTEAPASLERYTEPRGPGADRKRRTRYSVPGRELIDTLDAVRRYDFGARDLPGYGLKEVARHFGIAAPDRVYLPGAAVFPTYRDDPELVRRYALDDVTEVDALSRRLLGAPFALAGMAPRRFERIASAGPAMGILQPMLVRAYLRAGAALPAQSKERDEDDQDAAHLGGAVHLFATGVAEHVIKADIASLYPSLMRTFQIGPASDHLNVVLSIVDRLTDLRLQHKAAAHAEARSKQRSHHDATQNAMKILINSAYGYMGAGSMALFADSRAAAEVTRHGREILDRVVGELRTRGMELIEADTDGVYVAVPSEWTEGEERTLVTEVAETLPAGIRLDYEGRYRAMFSHEVKNYALLTYDGELIVRGVALHSSRSEPFGERFLRKALLCLMAGDVPGLRDTYLRTVAALRERALPAAELASRVRLSKTFATYMAARTAHQEPHYEALLAAGRTNWFPGERVRFYRTEGSGACWLPDETEDAAVWDTLEGGNEQSDVQATAVERGTETRESGRYSGDPADRRDYHVDYYLQTLLTSYAGRLRKAFAPDDFEQLFRRDDQLGLFDKPIEEIQPRWIRCQSNEQS